MAGTAETGGAGAPRRSTWLRVVLVIVLVAILAVSAVVYVVSVGGPRSNTPPHGRSILVVPSTGNNTTIFRFTAQATDDQDPASALRDRWDWQDDGTWDTAFATNKTAVHEFPAPGSYTVRMEVEDTGGLTANTTVRVDVLPSNQPPHILGIAVSPSTGTNATTFNFTASVTDDYDPVNAIQVRWDWQSDGVWDTNWSTTKAASHRFPVPGNYTVAVQARDTAGLASRGSIRVPVSGPEGPPPPLRIGTILSLTGALQVYGMPEQNAVVMAVNEINANGGVLAQPIQLFNLDDGTNPGTAAQAAATLVHVDNVSAIIGSTFSGGCAVILPVAEAADVFEVSPSCTSPIFSNLTYTGGWFARTVPSDALQGIVAASFAYTNLSLRRAAVIGINNAYGVGLSFAFAENFTRLGGALTSPPRIVNEVSGGVTDYTPDLVAVLGATPAPEVVYVVAYPPDGFLMMEDWWNGIRSHPAWANVNWTFSDGLYDPTFIGQLATAGVNVSKFRGTSPAAYAGFEPAAYAAWAARYQTLYGSPPTLFASNAYDAAYLIALAAEAAGNTTGWGIRGQLRAVANPPGTSISPNQWTLAVQEFGLGHEIDYEGASGGVDVGPHGDVPSAMIIWGVNATNQFITVAFFPEALVASLLPPGTFALTGALPGQALLAVWPSRRTS